MRIEQALDFIHACSPAKFEGLSDLLSPELVQACLAETGSVSLRRRRMPMERVLWAIIGMSLFRHAPMAQLANQLDILLPGDRPFVVPSAFIQARQKLSDKAVEMVFNQTVGLWHQQCEHPTWAGLQLLALGNRTGIPGNEAELATEPTRRCCSNQGTIPQFGDLIS